MLNNYSIREVRRLVADGEYPEHHLWGMPLIDSCSGRKWRWTAKALYDWGWIRRLKLVALRGALVKAFGDPVQVFGAIRASRRSPTTVYSADQRSCVPYLVLKRLRLVRAPIVVLVHHPPAGAWQRWVLGAADRLLCLNDQTAGSLASVARAPAQVMHWGPETLSRVYELGNPSPVYDFFAAGKTNRSYRGLRDLAVQRGLSGLIFDGRSRTSIRDGVVTVESGSCSYPEILAEMARSRCVVIPLRDSSVMAGLTEVADAIALDLPIIASRSSAFPYDIEHVGVGLVYDGGDNNQLWSALDRVLAGELAGARALGDFYSASIFARELEQVFTEIERGL